MMCVCVCIRTCTQYVYAQSEMLARLFSASNSSPGVSDRCSIRFTFLSTANEMLASECVCVFVCVFVFDGEHSTGHWLIAMHGR